MDALHATHALDPAGASDPAAHGRHSVAPAVRANVATAHGVQFAAPPLAEMWADDAIWLPRVLAGARVRGDFRFADHSTITRSSVVDVPAGERVCAHVADAATAVLVLKVRGTQ